MMKMGLINLSTVITPLDDMSVGEYHPLNNTYISSIETVAGFVSDIKFISTGTYMLSSYSKQYTPTLYDIIDTIAYTIDPL